MRPARVPRQGPGALWIWRAPRLLAQGVHPQDAARLQGLHRVVSLLPESSAQLSARQRAYAQLGLAFESAPTRDFGVPSPAQLQGTLDSLQAALGRGEGVLVHCMAGLGRAGTLCACVLVREGCAPRAAIQALRAVRPGAIEVAAQEALVTGLGLRAGSCPCDSGS